MEEKKALLNGKEIIDNSGKKRRQRKNNGYRLFSVIVLGITIALLVLLIFAVLIPKVTLTKVEAAYEKLRSEGVSSLSDKDIDGIEFLHRISWYFEEDAEKNMDSLIQYLANSVANDPSRGPQGNLFAQNDDPGPGPYNGAVATRQ